MTENLVSTGSSELVKSFQSWLSNNNLEPVTNAKVPECVELFPASFIMETFLDLNGGNSQEKLEALTDHYQSGHFFKR